MKTVGIIGGLGPETTNKFCLEIINFCLKNNKNQRPPMLIWNVPMLIKVERDLITKNIGEEKFLPFLVNAARILEQAGSNFLVMPCNTAHIFIKEIRDSINIPVLSIIEETILTIKEQRISQVGLLATSATIRNNLFTNKFKQIGIKQVTPDKKDQHQLDQIIHRLVLGKRDIKDKVWIDGIITKMAKEGITKVILACTDLQLLIKKHPQVAILDTMQILAKATTRAILEGGD